MAGVRGRRRRRGAVVVAVTRGGGGAVVITRVLAGRGAGRSSAGRVSCTGVSAARAWPSQRALIRAISAWCLASSASEGVEACMGAQWTAVGLTQGVARDGDGGLLLGRELQLLRDFQRLERAGLRVVLLRGAAAGRARRGHERRGADELLHPDLRWVGS